MSSTSQPPTERRLESFTKGPEEPRLDRDFLFLHLRALPYFRSITRSIEAGFWQDFNLPRPVIDIGCGDGHFASVAFDEPLDVGLDPWGGPIQEAKTWGGYRALVQADGGQIPLPDESFACAISNSVLEHIPHVEQVLVETARVLKPGAPFLFCVPNPRHNDELAIPALMRRLGLNKLAERYVQWWIKITRTHHADMPDVWAERLERAGFRLERWWHYMPPKTWHAVEWGHYLSSPTLLPHKLTGRWILVPSRWNLALTERFVRPLIQVKPSPDGIFTFYVATKA